VAVLLTVIVIGLTTAGMLIVLMIALIQHLKVLSASLRGFQEEVRPALEAVQRDAMGASDRLEGLAEQGARLQEQRTTRRPGARIRR
jgi:hypothetical protein